LRKGEWLGLIGDAPYLGAWEAQKALPLCQQQPNEWVVALNADAIHRQTFESIFVILDAEKDVTPMWETCGNRSISQPEIKPGSVIVYELEAANFEIYPWRGA
jgi:4-alpha-glucanotransferase